MSTAVLTAHPRAFGLSEDLCNKPTHYREIVVTGRMKGRTFEDAKVKPTRALTFYSRDHLTPVSYGVVRDENR